MSDSAAATLTLRWYRDKGYWGFEWRTPDGLHSQGSAPELSTVMDVAYEAWMEIDD